jgi:hypothetical protein
MRDIKKKVLRVARILGVNVLILIVLLSMLEGAWLYTLSHSELIRKLPPNFAHNISAQYMSNDRSIIQFMSSCAKYDSVLSYTLKPGTCRFENPEFSVEVRVNTIGLRDDEQSLDAPEVIVIGDSHAMGWGVEQDKTFPSLIEKALGMKVLNTAISSYGTAREVLLLNQLDLSNLRYLVIQYNENDKDENRVFPRKGPMSREKYEQEVKDHQDSTEYFFGAHIIRFIKAVLTKDAAPQAITQATTPAGQEAVMFLQTIEPSVLRMPELQIVLIEIDASSQNDTEFIGDVRALLKRYNLPLPLENMSILDASSLLTEDDYFILDDHINAAGHKKVARVVMDAMRIKGE